MTIDSNHKEVPVERIGVGVDSRLQRGQESAEMEGEMASVDDTRNAWLGKRGKRKCGTEGQPLPRGEGSEPVG